MDIQTGNNWNIPKRVENPWIYNVIKMIRSCDIMAKKKKIKC